MRNNAGQRPPPLQACRVVGVYRGSCCFTPQLLRSTRSLVRYARFSYAWRLHSLPSLPLWGKYQVRMFHCFFGVTLPGGCHSQGRHGYRTHCSCACGSTIQAPSPSSSIVDEFKLKTNKQTNHILDL